MVDDDLEVIRIANGIGARLLGVCMHLSSADFAGLCMSMARVQLRGEYLLNAAWPKPLGAA